MNPIIEKPVTYNTAILYNEKHSRFDALAEEKRLAIVNAPNGDYTVSGTTYYVSPNGDDEADGTTPETAWRTLPRVAAAKDDFKEGDAVLFERGGVYRGQVFVRSGMTFAAYGEGPKPCLYGSWRNYADPSLWQATDTPNVWKVIVPEEEKDIGNIIFDHGVACGRKQPELKLCNDFEFYFVAEEQAVYLYLATGNPGEVYEDVELAARFNLMLANIPGTHDVLIDNLCVKYAGCHGIQFRNTSYNITVRNCEIGYIGGCLLRWASADGKQNAARYGNGFEVVGNCRNITVENNWVYQCFDAGITHQSSDAVHVDVDHIRFADNLLEYSPYNIEYYVHREHGTMTNVVYENNIMRFAGFGFGTLDRFGSNTSVVSHVCAYYRAQPCDNFIIRNNIMDTSYRHLTAIAYPNDPEGRGPTITGNTYVQSPFENEDTKADIALTVDVYVSGWHAFEENTHWCHNRTEMEESVAAIDLAPAAVYYDE